MLSEKWQVPRNIKEGTLMFLGFTHITKETLLAIGKLYRQMRHRKEGEKISYPPCFAVRKMRHKD